MLLAARDMDTGATRMLRDYLHAQAVRHEALDARLLSYSQRERMTHAEWWDCLNQTQRLLPGRAIGLEIGQRLQPAHLGVLGYLLLTSASLADALQRFQRFISLLHQSDTVIIEFQNDQLVLRWTNDYGPAPRLSDEVYFSAILRFMRLCTGQHDFRFSRLQFTFPEPADWTAHARLFDCPLLFNQPFSEIRLPLMALTLPVNHADPALSAMLEEQASALMAALPQADNFISLLRDVLVRTLQTGNISADIVATQLAMSRRTLHRRLIKLELDFSTVLQRIREQLARQYLGQASLSLTEIALLLGYTEQSTFTRAFKQWTGETPLRFRQKIRP